MSRSGEALVVGAGLAGLCAAYYLRASGWSVRVVERREGPGLETSYANAGMATPSMSEPWNTPGIHRDIIRGLLGGHSALAVRPAAMLAYSGWGLRFLLASRRAHYTRATQANFALSAYSVAEIRALRGVLDLRYEARTAGTLKVFATPADYERAAAEAGQLAQYGLRYQALDRAGAERCEPLLSGFASTIAGALHYPDDETGDAHLFCRTLQARLADAGVRFDFGTAVQALLRERGVVRGVQTSHGPRRADATVICAAAWSPALLRGTGVRIAVRPVKGYSLTAPLHDEALMPRLSIIDEARHVAITPFESRIRMAGFAELAGWDSRLDEARLGALWQFAQSVNPAMAQAIDRGQASAWCGFRPMAADGNPYIGPTALPGLFLSTGHGYLGWTQSAGGGRLLADLVSGRQPDIDPAPYRVGR